VSKADMVDLKAIVTVLLSQDKLENPFSVFSTESILSALEVLEHCHKDII
jgi:hypothetical protein